MATKKQNTAMIDSKIDGIYAVARMTVELADAKHTDEELLAKLSPLSNQIIGMISIAEAMNLRLNRVPFNTDTIRIWRQHNNNMAA